MNTLQRYQVKTVVPDADPVSEMFAPLCTIYADTSQVARHAKLGTNGVYYVQNFDVVLLCGMTEMQAQISWVENVSPCRSVMVFGIIDVSTGDAEERASQDRVRR